MPPGNPRRHNLFKNKADDPPDGDAAPMPHQEKMDMRFPSHADRVDRRTALTLALGFSASLLTDRPARAHGSGHTSGIARSVADYNPPSVTLIDAVGEQVRLDGLLAESKPVILEFFFTTCTTICGLQASVLSDAQKALGAVGDCTMLSVSIDPEYDTPARLREFAASFEAQPNWRLLTGRQQDILRVLVAFNARYPGDNKMLHQPFTFIRAAPDRQWLRLEGLLTSDELIAEYKQALAEPTPRSRYSGRSSGSMWRRMTN